MFGPSSYLIVIVCFAILIPIIYRVGRRESALADVICLGCAARGRLAHCYVAGVCLEALVLTDSDIDRLIDAVREWDRLPAPKLVLVRAVADAAPEADPAYR